MRIKSSTVLLQCVIIAGVFWAGTQYGKHSVIKFNENVLASQTGAALIKSNTSQTEISQDIPADNNNHANTVARIETENQAEPRQGFEPIQQPDEDASPIEWLEYLLAITSSDNPDDISYFAKTIDKLRQSVATDPESLQLLNEYFLSVDSDSKYAYYITSIIQGSDIPNKQLVINNLVQRLVSIGTDQANEKLLHLVSSTGAHVDNQNISQALIDIGLYSTNNTTNRLYALEILHPFQLNEGQKDKIVTELLLELPSSNNELKSYVIENIMKFSNTEQRQSLAQDFLATDKDFETRVAVLNSINNGTLQTSDELKKLLLNITKEPNDALNEHAKHALLYTFDITNEEYQALKN